MQSSLPEQLYQHAAFRNPPVRWIVERLERWLLARADLVVSSAGLAERVHRIAPDTTVREWRFSGSVATLDPVEADAIRARLDIDAEQPVVLYSGTFEKYQGLNELLGAIPFVRAEQPRVVFVLVGADLSGNGATARLRDSGSLQVIGRQPRSALAGYHAVADVLVSPRIYGANLPLKIFSYLAAGRPIVATDLPSHRTVLSEDRAVLVSPNAEAIAQGIIELLDDPERAARLGEAARRYANEYLDWTKFVRGVRDLYDEVQEHAERA
jgi:glycosyltransferase involved in cell wall biosynthesis